MPLRSFHWGLAASLLAATALLGVSLLPAEASAQRKKIVFGEEEEGSVVEGSKSGKAFDPIRYARWAIFGLVLQVRK